MQNDTKQFTENADVNLDHKDEHHDSQMEQKDAEIRRLQDELTGTQQYLNDFVYVAAHALKSPVANLNLITILLEKTYDIDEIKSYLDTIKSSVKRLDQTIQGMVLGFQVAAIDDDATMVPLSNTFESVVMRLQGSINSMNIKIKGNFDACPEIVFKKNILSEILNNLLQNSIDYKAEDRGLQIEVRTERYGNEILLEVIDNGIGIDLEKHCKDIFQPFKRLSSCANGNGMALYLVKTLVEKNKGKIEIESKPNEGTTVKCYLKEH